MTEQSKSRTAIGFAWYRCEAWEELKAFCDDQSKLEKSYDEWKSNAEKAFRDLEHDGFHVETIDFDLKEFKAWCQLNRKPPTAASRSEFAVLKLRQWHESMGKTQDRN